MKEGLNEGSEWKDCLEVWNEQKERLNNGIWKLINDKNEAC